MKSLVFLLASTLVFLAACHTDDVRNESNKSPLIEIMFTNYLLTDASGYVVVTDLQGSTLASALIENQKTIILTPAKSYDEDVINVYLILKASPFYHTSAYLNIQRGSTWDFSGKTVRGNLQNPVRLTLKNLPTTFDYLTFGTNAFGYSSQSSFLDTLDYGTQFNYFASGKAFAQIVTNGEGKFNTFNIDGSKSNVDIDFNMLTKTSLKKTISIPSGLYGSYQLTGNPDDTTDETYFLFSTNLYADRAMFPIYYLDLPMKRYNTWLSATGDGKKIFYYSNTGDIVTHYEPLTMDATLSNASASDFQANFTGDFDFYNAEYGDAQNRNFIHVFSAKKMATFQIPDFSKEFPVPAILFSDMKLQMLSLVDVSDFVEDQRYFKYYSTMIHASPVEEKRVLFRYQ